MKKLIYILIASLLGTGLVAQNKFQRKSRFGFEINRKPAIYYNYFVSNFEQPGEFHFMIYIQYDILQFINTQSVYTAEFEISIALKEKENSVFSENWKEKIEVGDFEITNSREKYFKSYRNFKLTYPKDKLNLFVEVRDPKSNNIYFNKQEIKIYQVQPDSLNVSDIVLLDRRFGNADSLNLTGLTSQIEFDKTSYTFFEIFTPQEDSLYIKSKTINLKTKDVLWDLTYDFLPKTKVFRFTESFDKRKLYEGNLKTIYTINYGNKQNIVEKEFEIIWFDKPIYLYKPDLALRPMRYILAKSEFETTEDLDKTELKKWFDNYWKQRDPTPETPYNEVQLEFFRRVEIANKKYNSRFREGWETALGKYYILYGEPDRVESRLFITEGKPYIVWYYDKLNQKIMFLRSAGSEEFEKVVIEKIKE